MVEDEPVLHCANWVMNVIHENLSFLVEKDKITASNIIRFLNELDQDIQGLGGVYVDIAEFFQNTPEDLKLFISLVRRAIEKAEYEKRLNGAAARLAWEFKSKLDQYLKKIANL